MAYQNGLMISVSGIRGIVGQGLTPDVVQRFVAAYTQMINGKKIVVGRDSRKSGIALQKIVVGTLMACGYDVVELGLCPTPTVGMAVLHMGADGGIVITASHNPKEWNALKLMNSQGLFLSQEQGQELLRLYSAEQFSYASSEFLGEHMVYPHACQDHMDRVLRQLPVQQIRAAHFKVAVDCVNGAGSVISEIFLKALGCDVVAIHNEPHRDFPRDPEPTEKNLQETMSWMKDKDYDLCFVQDPDADRLAIIDGQGRWVGEEWTLALVVDYVLSTQSHVKDVVANVSSSMILDTIAKKYGARMHRSEVGEAHVVAKMHETGALIGGEGNGGVIYGPSHYGRDSLVGMGLILALLASRNKKLQDIVSSWPAYVMSKEKVALSASGNKQSLAKLQHVFFDATLDATDGTKYIWNDAWIHVRASNTEPVVRIIAEAATAQRCQEILKDVKIALAEETAYQR